jgi:hypothetical protein
VTRHAEEKFGCYPSVAIRGDIAPSGVYQFAACAVNRDPANLQQVNDVRFLQFLFQGVSADAVEGASDEVRLFRLEMERVA